MAQKSKETTIQQIAGQALNALIEEQVRYHLGSPTAIRNVQVHRLWEGRYRVNVYKGKDAASARISTSYFVAVDNRGYIVRTSPNIARFC